MENNLWGSFDDITENINNPKDILEEQAKCLAESLNGLVKGQVERITLNKGWIDFYQRIKQEYNFAYEMLVLSDYVEKYSYDLMTIAYGIRMYPVAITVSSSVIEELEIEYQVLDGDTVVAENEDEFKEILMKIFAAKEVRQVLRGLRSIAQKESETIDEFF